MSNNINQNLWTQIFPTLPPYALPTQIPENMTSSELIVFVKENMRSIVDAWTNTVRFQGVNGRLAMHEDDSWDIDARRSLIIFALVRAGAYNN